MKHRVAAFLFLVAMTSLITATSAPPAYACSCAGASVPEMLSWHGAAFIGTLTDDGREQIPTSGEYRTDDQIVVTFSVDQWIKGDFGDEIQLQTAISGASCGLEIGEGTTAAIFVYDTADGFGTGLCSTMSAEVVRAGLGGFPMTGEGPASLLVAGSYTNGLLLALDAAGQPLGLIEPPQAEGVTPTSLFGWDVCPGGRFQVELYDWAVAVRSLEDLSLVESFSLAGFADEVGTSSVLCRDEAATDIWLLGEHWDGEAPALRIHDVRDGVEPLFDVPGIQGVLGDTVGVFNDFDGSVWAVPWSDPTAVPLYESSTGGWVSGAAISPDGTKIAVLDFSDSGAGEGTGTLTTFDAGTLEQLAQREIAGVVEHLTWPTEDRMQVVAHGAAGITLLQFDETLDQVASEVVDRWNVWGEAWLDDRVVSVDEGTVLFRDIGGEPQVATTLPVVTYGPVIPLTTPVDGARLAEPTALEIPIASELTVDPTTVEYEIAGTGGDTGAAEQDGEATSNEADEGTTREPVDGSSAAGPSGDAGTSDAIVAAIVVLVAAAGVFGYWLRRRRRTAPIESS